MTRRQVVLAGAILPALPFGLAACSTDGTSSAYDEAAMRMHQPLLMAPGGTMPMRELVRYATLAPSSHNTQCWKFRVDARAVELRPDLWRRCPTVDPDDHHVFVSLGCATENLVQAALANGLHSEVVIGPSPGDALRIELQEFVKARLSKHKYPRLLEFVEDVPKNDRGKVDRKALAVLPLPKAAPKRS